jgi:hypothetical protein
MPGAPRPHASPSGPSARDRSSGIGADNGRQERARSGRRKGSLIISWSKTPAAVAGHYLNGLFDVARRSPNTDAP